MTELLTTAQMRAIEQAAIDSGTVTGLELMERAGRGVVDAIFEEWPELSKTSHRAVVLCGPGNNGGDGFVVARLLKDWGWEVEVFHHGDAAKLPPDAKTNYGRWREMGGVSPLVPGVLADACERANNELEDDPNGEKVVGGRRTIFVDALFGTGLSRPLDATLAEIATMEWSDECWENGVAVEIPSGICADSGRRFENFAAFCAKLTVTFQASKVGHFLGEWSYDCPSLRVVDLGLRDAEYDLGECVHLAASLPVIAHDFTGMALNKLSDGHKYNHGHALILSGGVGKGGAARLAARGALRIGAGLVTVGCPPAALQENAAQLNAIMLMPMKGPEAFEQALEDERINALCLGPGLGVSERTQHLVRAALTATRRTVLDADALSSFADDPDTLFDLLHEDCVLTPHAGEFKRLFPDIAAKLTAPATIGPAYSKVDAAREAARRAGCTVLFKGPDTVIADPQGRCSVNAAHYHRAAPWLATAGSGDVLAGFITGLLARGFDPMAAAETAAWLHVECARDFGPGLIAEDLPETLPRVLKHLGV